MKKIIAISLVAILAVGSVFAAITLSGEAKGVFSYDIDGKKLGFEEPTTTVKASIEATTQELVNEGEVYATVKATLGLKVGDLTSTLKIKDKDGNPLEGQITNSNQVILVDKFKIDYAKIVGPNWYVGIIGAPAPTDFAASWEYNADDNVRVNFVNSTFHKDYGVEVGLYDYVAGVTLAADFNEGGSKNAYATLKTPEYAIADGLTAQAGATIGNFGDVFLGFGGKVAYATDTLTADVATDVAFKFTEDLTYGYDVAANVEYAPVAVNAYYASKLTSKTVTPDDDNATEVATGTENYLSARAVVDLASFDVPVKLTVLAQDLVNTQYFDAKADVSAVENLTITGFGGYHVGQEAWHAGAGASYVIDQVGTAAASLKLDGDKTGATSLTAKASLTNTTLVSGATLKLAYESGNYLADKAEIGKISASAQIKF